MNILFTRKTKLSEPSYEKVLARLRGLFIYEPRHEKTFFLQYANNKDAVWLAP